MSYTVESRTHTQKPQSLRSHSHTHTLFQLHHSSFSTMMKKQKQLITSNNKSSSSSKTRQTSMYHFLVKTGCNNIPTDDDVEPVITHTNSTTSSSSSSSSINTQPHTSSSTDKRGINSKRRRRSTSSSATRSISDSPDNTSPPRVPFWDPAITPTLSQCLWLANTPQSAVAEAVYSKWTRLARRSWYTANIVQRHHASTPPMFEPPVADAHPLPAPDNTKTKLPTGKARRVRLYPSKQQDILLKRWNGTARKVYNLCVDAIQKKKVRCNKKALRAAFLNTDFPPLYRVGSVPLDDAGAIRHT